MERYVINIDNYEENLFEEKVGGKAYSLLRLNALSLNIPAFFVITTDAFKDFLCINKIEARIEKLFRKKDYRNIRNLLMEQEIPDEIWGEICQAYNLLDSKLVSVRSSALLEDGEMKSFAGQFDSQLFIPFSDLQKNIKRCWASYYNDNAVEYAEQIPSFSGMAVVIQKMIDADISGIGFSKSPVASYEDCVLIEAAHGVGENIVSGVITPNQYHYSMKEKRILSVSAGGVLTDTEVEMLAENICEIRDLFQLEVDTEWCIENNIIYFLQARPITAIERKPIPYKKTLIRPLPLIRVELYAMGEYEGIKWLTDDQFYFNPLFIYEDGKVTIYYNNISQKENPINMYEFLCRNYDDFLEKYSQAMEACGYIEKTMMGETEFEAENFILAIQKIYPFSSLGNLAGNLPENLVGKVYDTFKVFREEKGELLTKAEEFLLKYSEGIVGSELLYFCKITDVFGQRDGEQDEIKERKQGYLYFNKMLLAEKQYNEINEYLNSNHIALLDGEEETMSNPEQLTGTSAYGGKIKGAVTVIENEEDFNKMQKGDILVASMTVPKFLPVMKIAGAMVTDEGGVLCHAAIVARELKIPTIIGTKQATAILADGDLVEVDANNGRVRIMKKGYRNLKE